jgi:hypothetical protein
MRHFYEGWTIGQIWKAFKDSAEQLNELPLKEGWYKSYKSQEEVESILQLESGVELVSGLVLEDKDVMVVIMAGDEINLFKLIYSTEVVEEESVNIMFAPITCLEKYICNDSDSDNNGWCRKLTGYCILLPWFDGDGKIVTDPVPYYYTIALHWKEQNKEGVFCVIKY